jgi:hypothetical protein
MAPVALAWLRHQTVPVIPIIGARKVSQLQDNLASLDLELSAEQLKSLDGASRIELGFPQSIYEREMVRAIRYGGMEQQAIPHAYGRFLARPAEPLAFAVMASKHSVASRELIAFLGALLRGRGLRLLGDRRTVD